MVSTISAVDLNFTGNITVAGNTVISGNMSAAGTIYANYADLAEYFDVKKDVVLKPGDPTSIAGLRTLTTYNGKNYAGIISTEPGVMLGRSRTQAIALALAGTVPVRTSDTSIKIGDTLVLTKKGKIIRKRFWSLFLTVVGIAQEKYKKTSFGPNGSSETLLNCLLD